jgi:hypothetical protein
MIDEDLDLLQLKIEKMKKLLPEESLNAIDSVDWRSVILEMKEKKGYTFEQLGDLEIETELVIYGLITPEEFLKQITAKLKLTPDQANMLVEEMNLLVFKKIKDALVRNIERKRDASAPTIRAKILPNDNDNSVLKEVGIQLDEVKETPGDFTPLAERGLEGEADMLKKIENPSLIKNTPREPAATPILAQKLTGSFKLPSTETDHSQAEASIKKAMSTPTVTAPLPKIDPYRMNPEE